jgi:hypothetical protein
LSIIIVGVGNEDFSAMEELDSDKQLLRAGAHCKKTFSSSLTLCTKSYFLGAMSLKKLLQKAGNSN